MGQTHHPQLNRQAYEWTKLIRKLRWIGMEDDAHHWQLAMCGLPPHERCAGIGGAIEHRLIGKRGSRGPTTHTATGCQCDYAPNSMPAH
jgi:hypothetical protein